MATPPVARGPRTGALDPSVVRRWVERTCAEQGLRVAITDPNALAQVAALFGALPVNVQAVAT
jgi:hypothetical protein